MNLKLFSISLIVTLISIHGQAHENHKGQLEVTPKPVLGESIYNLNSRWTTQYEKIEKLSALRDRPVVMAMIYTSCKDACPLIVSDMQKIERGLPPETLDRVQFVLVSFDPDADTPQKLKDYAKSYGLDLKRWTLFHGPQADVRGLAAILDIRYKKVNGSDFEHSNVITVLDSEGIIKHQQVGLNQNPKETLGVLQSIIKK